MPSYRPLVKPTPQNPDHTVVLDETGTILVEADSLREAEAWIASQKPVHRTVKRESSVPVPQ